MLSARITENKKATLADGQFQISIFKN